MAESLKLYPAQQEGVERFLASRGRFVFTYGTGCGKTPTAITSILKYFARTGGDARGLKILVVCPAIVRRHWCKEFQRWAELVARPIEMGRTRKGLSKRLTKEREEAYASCIQAVSYDLLPHVDAEGWDFIVFDEVHHLSDPTSKQSQNCRAILRANPGVPCIALSATLIPTQVKQVWHPMHLLFGSGEWGAPARTGGVSWQFVSKFCVLTKNEYGTHIGPGIPAKMPELRNKLLKVCHRVTREDISAELPPLDVKLLELGGTQLNPSPSRVLKMRPEAAIAMDWYDELPEDITHAVVLVYHRALAEQVARIISLRAKDTMVQVIDGSMPTGVRVEYLERIEKAPRAVLVATSESIREGVRLMWAQKVLFAEWRQSPAQVVQVLGRFQDASDPRRPQIEVLTDESLYGQAETLMERVRDINSLVKAGAAEAVVEQVFAPKELTAERMKQLTLSMMAQGPRDLNPEWTEDSEGDEDGW